MRFFITKLSYSIEPDYIILKYFSRNYFLELNKEKEELLTEKSNSKQTLREKDREISQVKKQLKETKEMLNDIKTPELELGVSFIDMSFWLG